MTMTIAYTKQQSERWLLERTYHARLRNGRELSVPDLTRAMKQMTNIAVPLSTWQEISPEEAHVAYQHGIPVLLSSEHAWEHPEGAPEPWRPNRNMRAIIYGKAYAQSEVISGIE